jgi:predicted DCC family thiol-disulfide oxidoreductase YuxK
MKAMSSWQFTLFRVVFGGYLAVHFLQLAPWAGELFGHHGLMPQPSLNPAHGLFPNPLDLPLSDGLLSAILALLAAVALLFAAGQWRRTAALILWFGWTALFHRNNLILNPSVPYVGLLLVLSALVPGGEPWSRGRRDAGWAMPKWVFRSAWILMAVGYSFSGLTKLPSESWIDGSALRHLLENPLARPGAVREALVALPDVVLKLLTWGTLAVELLFAPLALWARSRPWIWLTLVLTHLGILAVVDFADLSFGMLMLHLFTFDPEWLPPRGTAPLVVRFDGECLMCSRTIRFVAAEDRAGIIRFKPLDAEGEPDSMLVETGGRVLDRSSGVLAILGALGGHWRAMALAGRLIPRPLRDLLYRFIARHRYRWFGKGDACGLPSEALKERLLD